MAPTSRAFRMPSTTRIASGAKLRKWKWRTPPGEWPKKRGLRGRPPNIKWSSTLPESAPSGGPSGAAIATWLKGTVTELNRIVTTLTEQAAQGLYIDDARSRSFMPHGATFAAPVRGGYGGETSTRGGGSRGGRPRPPVDLDSCLEIVNSIRADLGEETGRATDHEELVAFWGRAVDIGTRVKKAVEGSRRWAFHDDADLGRDVETLIGELATAERAWEAQRDKENSKGWKEWLEADWNTGAKRAHAYTKVPTGWAPTVVTTARGILSASPSAILDSMRDKYAKMWNAVQHPMAYRWRGNCEDLPLLTPEQLREASLSSAMLTSVTCDGWHVRQFALVSEEGLRALTVLLAAVERAGK